MWQVRQLLQKGFNGGRACLVWGQTPAGKAAIGGCYSGKPGQHKPHNGHSGPAALRRCKGSERIAPAYVAWMLVFTRWIWSLFAAAVPLWQSLPPQEASTTERSAGLAPPRMLLCARSASKASRSPP